MACDLGLRVEGLGFQLRLVGLGCGFCCLGCRI